MMKDTVKMTISKLPVRLSSSQPRVLEAEKWQPVCLSYIMSTNAGFMQDMPNLRHFPIWNLPLKHPVNLAYEAATADLNDVNMIDPFHLEAYGKTTVNYNRDVEIFPVLNTILKRFTERAHTNLQPIWV